MTAWLATRFAWTSSTLIVVADRNNFVAMARDDFSSRAIALSAFGVR
ncbi:MAG: hypothetical protein ACTMHS_05450 [Micrococcaceae bacterium]